MKNWKHKETHYCKENSFKCVECLTSKGYENLGEIFYNDRTGAGEEPEPLCKTCLTKLEN